MYVLYKKKSKSVELSLPWGSSCKKSTNISFFVVKGLLYRECLSGDEFLSGFESGISHNNPDALQDHCVIMYVENLRA